MNKKWLKKKIKELKIEVQMYETELQKLCPHKDVIYDSYIRANVMKYAFVCRDCGMKFITTNPNFKV